MLAFDPAVHVPEDIIAPADAPGTLPDMTAAPCLAAALDEAARLDGVPRSQTLAVALGAAALACSGVYDVRGAPQRGPLPTSLFILAEGRSGEGKSQSFKRLMKALHAHAARGRDTYAAEAEAWEASARETKKAGVPRAQPRPRNPDLTLPGMVTIQQLYRELAERPVLGWCSPDAGQVMGGHAFQPEHAMSTASALASAFSVEAMGNSTVRNGSLIVPAESYRLSVLFMMQPRPARDFYGRPELRSVGAAWRFLTFRVDPKEAHALRRAAADEARAGRLPSAATPPPPPPPATPSPTPSSACWASPPAARWTPCRSSRCRLRPPNCGGRSRGKWIQLIGKTTIRAVGRPKSPPALPAC